jgi:predicted negative regulator of RcsB-dependent stress response
MTPKKGTTDRWTVSSLKDYMEALILSNDERYSQRFLDSQTAVQAALSAARTAVDAALSAAKAAVDKAEATSDKRFEAVDEFRIALMEQQRLLMPRMEQEAINKAQNDKHLAYDKQFERLSGQRMGIQNAFAAAMAIGGFLLAAASIYYRHPAG